tara:strand:+ start:195 stop:506 length:312 start_codon:yes stop_codon:yes gene_type:complete
LHQRPKKSDRNAQNLENIENLETIKYLENINYLEINAKSDGVFRVSKLEFRKEQSKYEFPTRQLISIGFLHIIPEKQDLAKCTHFQKHEHADRREAHHGIACA